MKNIKILESYLHLFSKDVRSEKVMAILIQQGIITLEEVEYYPTGVGNIVNSNEKKQTKIQGGKLNIYSNQDGGYESFPFAFFHNTVFGKNLKTITSSKQPLQKDLDDLDLIENEKSIARDFFSIIEQEFFKVKVKLELEKKELANSTFKNLIRFWNFPYWLTSFEKKTIAVLLPYCEQLCGNIEFIQQLLEILTTYSVKFSYSESEDFHHPTSELKSVGNAILGYNSILGSSNNTNETVLDIEIESINPKEIDDYLEEKDGVENADIRLVHLVNYICDYFLPVEQKYSISLTPDETRPINSLSTKDQPTYLGYVFLG